jgi:hypothetical protein
MSTTSWRVRVRQVQLPAFAAEGVGNHRARDAKSDTADAMPAEVASRPTFKRDFGVMGAYVADVLGFYDERNANEWGPRFCRGSRCRQTNSGLRRRTTSFGAEMRVDHERLQQALHGASAAEARVMITRSPSVEILSSVSSAAIHLR